MVYLLFIPVLAQGATVDYVAGKTIALNDQYMHNPLANTCVQLHVVCCCGRVFYHPAGREGHHLPIIEQHSLPLVN